MRGQELDLLRFGAASAAAVSALETEEDLDEYIYCVAGCVGEFWTEMCRAYPLSGAALDRERMLEDGIRFGKGLQLVNILRDLPRDLSQGRCYLPRERLRQAGLRPGDLLETAPMERFYPVYAGYLDRAEAYLSDGWRYTTAIPARHVRIRLACSWPILIGIRTLGQLRAGAAQGDFRRVKLRRGDVRRLVLRSVVSYPCPGRWERLFEKVRREPVCRGTA